MDLSLTGKRALVCGSTQGIGKASAMALAAMGASVVLVARNEDSLRKTLAELPAGKDANHQYVVADFLFPEALKEKMESLVKQTGPIHVLVNNTGGPPGGPITGAKTAEFLQAFNNHLVCNHILAQAVIDGMKQEKYGRIINVISTSVKVPLKGLGVSNTVRAAVANWSKTLANEVAQFGITVNNVLPGATDTARLKYIMEDKAAKTGKTVDEIKKEMAAEVPMGRLAGANEIANAVAFLASPAASYITGINLPVDGGRTGCL